MKVNVYSSFLLLLTSIFIVDTMKVELYSNFMEGKRTKVDLLGIRRSRHMNRRKMADLCGISEPTLMRWEKSQVTRPTADTAIKIAREYGVDYQDLIWTVTGAQ